jgi:hypothetical protein
MLFDLLDAASAKSLRLVMKNKITETAVPIPLAVDR